VLWATSQRFEIDVPVFAEKFDGVRSADGVAAAHEIVCGTILITAPTDAFRVWWIQR